MVAAIQDHELEKICNFQEGTALVTRIITITVKARRKTVPRGASADE